MPKANSQQPTRLHSVSDGQAANRQLPTAKSQPPIPYGKQNITQADIDAVVEVLRSDFLTQGPKIAEFEDAFAAYVGSKYAVAVSNGTAALHLCTLTLGVKPGDKVITTPITFAASANCVRYCGGEVVFADIDPDTYLIDIEQVRNLLESSPKGTYTGIIPVDFAGRAVDLEAFRLLADEYALWMIEDACHAPGGFFIDSVGQKQHCGNGNFAELAIFSFHPVKHIAAGEGGMITTNNEAHYQRLLKLRTHGITKNESEFLNPVELALGGQQPTANSQMLMANPPSLRFGRASRQWPAWYMEMQILGYNYRLTDFQAALGLSQLARANEGLQRRREIAQSYYEAFEKSSTIIAQSGVVEGHAYHLYIIEVEDRFGLYNYLREKAIFTQVHYIPVHLMPYYQKIGNKPGDYPKAENYYKGCLSLPMYPSLTHDDQDYVIETINQYVNG